SRNCPPGIGRPEAPQPGDCSAPEVVCQFVSTLGSWVHRWHSPAGRRSNDGPCSFPHLIFPKAVRPTAGFGLADWHASCNPGNSNNSDAKRGSTMFINSRTINNLWREMDGFRNEVDRLFGRQVLGTGAAPALNVLEDDGAFYVDADLPDVSPEKLE